MTDDFDFGSFMDLDNQADLRTHCISLFSALAQYPQNVDTVNLHKSALINDPLVGTLEGLKSSVVAIELEDAASIVSSMSLLNLVVPSLKESKYDGLEQSQIDIIPALKARINNAKTKDDLIFIAHIFQWVNKPAHVSQRLHQVIDFLDYDPSIYDQTISALKCDDKLAALDHLLATLQDNHQIGFIAGDKMKTLLDRGVERWLAKLVTTDALSDVADEDLLTKNLCKMQLDEEILEKHPDFMDRLMNSCDILTSTGNTDHSGFLFLLLVKDEQQFRALQKINNNIEELPG